MKVTQHLNATITDVFPDDAEMIPGAVAYRLITWEEQDDDGHVMPFFEVQQSIFEVYEGGDAENGPRIYTDMTMWQPVVGGMGGPPKTFELAEFVKYHNQEEE